MLVVILFVCLIRIDIVAPLHLRMGCPCPCLWETAPFVDPKRQNRQMHSTRFRFELLLFCYFVREFNSVFQSIFVDHIQSLLMLFEERQQCSRSGDILCTVLVYAYLIGRAETKKKTPPLLDCFFFIRDVRFPLYLLSCAQSNERHDEDEDEGVKCITHSVYPYLAMSIVVLVTAQYQQLASDDSTCYFNNTSPVVTVRGSHWRPTGRFCLVEPKRESVFINPADTENVCHPYKHDTDRRKQNKKSRRNKPPCNDDALCKPIVSRLG